MNKSGEDDMVELSLAAGIDSSQICMPSWNAVPRIMKYREKYHLNVVEIYELCYFCDQLTLPLSKMKHHLVIGTWTPPGRLYTVAFDDEALSLELVKKTEIPEGEPISWLTISVCIQALQLTFTNVVQHDKKTLYGAAMKKWNSFAINSPTDIVHQVSHPLAGHRMH
jgi:hypothetical protein